MRRPWFWFSIGMVLWCVRMAKISYLLEQWAGMTMMFVCMAINLWSATLQLKIDRTEKEIARLKREQDERLRRLRGE